MTNNPARDYLRLAASSATAVGLVILLYDISLDAVHRAIHALKEGDVGQRTEELNRALAALGLLQGSLDFERGGEVARSLEQFYSVARAKVLEAQLKSSEEILRNLAVELLSLRDAWEQVDQATAGSPYASLTDDNRLAPAFEGPTGEESLGVDWSA